MHPFEPAYLQALRSSALEETCRRAMSALADCTLCPRQCHVNRSAGETGYCSTADRAVVASYDAHFGEERPLVGRHGSGTIFFTHCNLLCTFCQNYDISHQGVGNALDDRDLAAMMLHLQSQGCHNINLVTPSHVVPQFLSALLLAARQGLNIPIVYNTGGYDRVDTLRLLDGLVDIYMPDFKFWDADIARETCEAADYREIACRALLEMHRQVGDLRMDDQGVAQRGLLLRHLVLPHGLAGTCQVMQFVAQKVSRNTYVNVMAQYRPCGHAAEMEQLNRSITAQEYAEAVRQTKKQGLTRLDERKPIFITW